MKVLFALRSAPFARFLDQVFSDLQAEGHSVEVICQIYNPSKRDPDSPEVWLARQAKQHGFHFGPALRRRDRWHRYLFASRAILNYATYLRPGLQASQMVLERHKDHLPLILRRLVKYPLVRKGLLQPMMSAGLQQFERFVPPDRDILRQLEENRPDVVIASPMLMAGSEEVEYIKAAAALRIPTIAAIMSWDNLTTKGVFHYIPDITLVWNQGQVEEAAQFHNIPRDKIVVTGAPVFDTWFQMEPDLERRAFCQQVGLDPDRPYVLYLCSSQSIAQDETMYVQEVVAGLHQNSATRQLQILVRPHPWNAQIWQKLVGEGFAIWPPGRTVAVTPEIRQGLYNSIFFSEAVIGINTSAFIEAAILDKPCITILADRYEDTQKNISHFQHLLRANFLEVASDIPSTGSIIAELIAGHDLKRENRACFVRDFVRPWGINRPAGRIMISTIEAAAKRQSGIEINSMLAVDENAKAYAPQPVSMN